MDENIISASSSYLVVHQISLKPVIKGPGVVDDAIFSLNFAVELAAHAKPLSA